MSQSNQCLLCLMKNVDSLTCDVYPNGIPLEIITGNHDHSLPYPGDKGNTRIPIRFDSDGNVIVLTEQQERALESEAIQPDLSELRDNQLVDLFRLLDGILTDPTKLTTVRQDNSDYLDVDYYPTPIGKKVMLSRDLTKKITIAAALLKKPIAIFRDQQYHETTKEAVSVEIYVGAYIEPSDVRSSIVGAPARLRYAILRTVRNCGHWIGIARDRIELRELLGSVSGVQIYQK